MLIYCTSPSSQIPVTLFIPISTVVVATIQHTQECIQWYVEAFSVGVSDVLP